MVRKMEISNLATKDEISDIFINVFGHNNFTIEYSNSDNWTGYLINTKTFEIWLSNCAWNHQLRISKDLIDTLRYPFESTLRHNMQDASKEYVESLFLMYKRRIDNVSLKMRKNVIYFLQELEQYK